MLWNLNSVLRSSNPDSIIRSWIKNPFLSFWIFDPVVRSSFSHLIEIGTQWWKHNPDHDPISLSNHQILIIIWSPDLNQDPIAKFWSRSIAKSRSQANRQIPNAIQLPGSERKWYTIIRNCLIGRWCLVFSSPKPSSLQEAKEEKNIRRPLRPWLSVCAHETIGGWRSGPGGTRGTDQLQEWSCPKWNVRWLEMNCF